jgi:hypothetical protein
MDGLEISTRGEGSGMGGFSGFLPDVKSLVWLDSHCFILYKRMSMVGFPGSLLTEECLFGIPGFLLEEDVYYGRITRDSTRG